VNQEQAREQIISFCRLGWQKGYLAAMDGNISVRLGADRLLVTPSGRSKAMLQTSDLVEVDLEGRALGNEAKPSTELALHLAVYKTRPEANAVVHAHPPLSGAFSLAERELDLSGIPEALLHLGHVPIVPYAKPGGTELAEEVTPYLHDCQALLLSHHGTLTFSKDLETAWAYTEKLENAAHLLWATESLGGAKSLPLEAQQQLLEMGGHATDAANNALLSLDRRIEAKHLPITHEFSTEKRWQDKRGEAHLIINDRPLCRLCFLTLEPGAGYRGGHFHRRKNEGFYVVQGHALVELACSVTGERLSLEQEPGDRLWLPPGVAHRIFAPGPDKLEFIEFTDHPYDAADDVPFNF
jgi:L-fuculose-phosphate aldolase